MKIMCETCQVLQDEVARRKLGVLLLRQYLTQAKADDQFTEMKQLNFAALELRAAEDLFDEHQLEHLLKEIALMNSSNSRT